MLNRTKGARCAQADGSMRSGRRGTTASVVTLSIAGSVAAATACGQADERESLGVSREAAVSPVTVSFQNGVSPTSAYAGTDDATIREASAGTNYGTVTTCEADGDDGSGVDKSCLLRWTLSGIPAGSTVQSATITLRVTDASANTYGLHAVSRPWIEAQVSWQNARTGTPWETAGALGASDRGAVVGTVTGATGSRTVTLNAAGIAAVQSWVDGGTNAGIIIASTSNTDGFDVASSERSTTSHRPRLSVTYLPPDPGGSGGTGGTGGSSGGTGGSTAGAGGSSAGSGGSSAGGGGISTDPNLKIAFIGDTSTGTNFRNVLNLIKSEDAQAVLVQGDMSYANSPSTWWSDVNSVLGSTFPVFISRGNHDDTVWTGYLPTANEHLGGATRIVDAHDAHYKTTFRGLVIATIKQGDTGARITPFLQNDPHVWKVCQWHQNQQAMQVGGKTNEMGWDVYETCRQLGAIIQTGHEHSYSRTKTLTNLTSQVVDASCSTPGTLCVGPGRTFANVSGLGGNSVRDQTRCLPSTYPYGCNGEWAFIYTNQQNATYGAQFIVFNAGAPNRATGYFKTVTGQTVDTFTILHD
jgi:hypothetical protein